MPLLKYNIDTERKCKGYVSDLIITSIENGQPYELNFSFKNIGLNSITKMKLIVYYEDVLDNWYKQILNITYNASNIFEKGNYIGKASYSVEKEERIEESDINTSAI